MVKIMKTNKENTIAVLFNDEVCKYEVSTVNDWVIYLDEGPEIIVEGIVMTPDPILANTKELRNELASADGFIYFDANFTFKSSHNIKDYSKDKINKLIDYCRLCDMWIGWSLYRICININRPFNEQDASDIYDYSNRKITELKDLIQQNKLSIDLNERIWQIKDKYMNVSIDTNNNSARCEGTLYNKTFAVTVDSGFRGLIMDRILIPIEEIQKLGIDELVAFKNSISVKALEILLDSEFSYYGQYVSDTVEFSFSDKKSFDINKIISDLNLA